MRFLFRRMKNRGNVKFHWLNNSVQPINKINFLRCKRLYLCKMVKLWGFSSSSIHTVYKYRTFKEKECRIER